MRKVTATETSINGHPIYVFSQADATDAEQKAAVKELTTKILQSGILCTHQDLLVTDSFNQEIQVSICQKFDPINYEYCKDAMDDILHSLKLLNKAKREQTKDRHNRLIEKIHNKLLKKYTNFFDCVKNQKTNLEVNSMAFDFIFQSLISKKREYLHVMYADGIQG